jgi:hypothetical protein
MKIQNTDKVKYIGLEIEWNSESRTAKVGMAKRVQIMQDDFNITTSTRKVFNPAKCKDFSRHEGSSAVPFGDVRLYRSLVMTLAYISVVFPEVKYHVGHLATRQSGPSKRDYKKAVQVAQYVCDNRDSVMNVHALGSGDIAIDVFTDAAFDVYPDSKSHGGVAVFIGDAGCAMYTSSNKQHCITRSSTDAEIVHAEAGMFMGNFFRDFLSEFGINACHRQRQDNMSAITLVETGVRDYSRRERNMIRKINFMKEYFDDEANRAWMEWCHTEYMTADGLTKDLHGEGFEFHTSTLHGNYR